MSLRKFYAPVYDNNLFPSLVASLFSWRCLAASISSFLYATINLNPCSVTTSTHIFASNAVGFQPPAMPNARTSLCTQSIHSFSFPPWPFRTASSSRFPNNMIRFGNRSPLLAGWTSVPDSIILVVVLFSVVSDCYPDSGHLLHWQQHFRYMYLIITRVWINQVRLLPILLLVVSRRTGKFHISLTPFAPDNLISRGRVRPFRPEPACSFSTPMGLNIAECGSTG